MITFLLVFAILIVFNEIHHEIGDLQGVTGPLERSLMPLSIILCFVLCVKLVQIILFVNELRSQPW